MKNIFTLLILAFTVLLNAQTPTVYTLGHDPITTGPYNFNLYGVVNGHALSTQYSFVYSTDPGFSTSTTTPAKTVSTDSLTVVYSTLNGLTPATTYYYYLTANSTGGTGYGSTNQFYSDTTSPLFEIFGADVYPSVQFGNGASLNGKLKGLTGSHVISFEWGDKPLLDSVVLSDAGTVSDVNPHYPRAFLGGLVYGKLYYYRMKAVSATDSIFSDIRPFFMGFPFNVVNTLPATSIASTTAKLNGQAQGFQVPLKLDVEYGIGSYNHHSPLVYVDSNTVLYNFVYSASGLQSEQMYGYRFRAESWLGNFYGLDKLFITGNRDSVFQTLPATNVTGTTATLHGFAQKINFEMVDGFDYGTTPALGTFVITDTITDVLAHAATTVVNGLQPNTTYYFALRGKFRYDFSPDGARVYGDTLQFTTGVSGIDELKEGGKVNVYPNPATSQINFAFENNADLSQLKITDIAGRELLTKTTITGNRIDISTLANGIYMVQCFNKAGDKIGIAKFAKQ